MSEIDNVIAALEHNDRVREVALRGFNSFQLEKVLSAMQKPFPELTGLTLRWIGGTVPVFPDSFLGRSAPRLQTLQLDGIPSLSLRKLLLFATDIVTLSLGDLSRSVHISPEELVTCLSALASLRYLSFGFVSLPFLPDKGSRHSPPPARIFLPSLTRLSFEGVSEYLMDFVARIDAPLLDHIFIEFFDEPITDSLPLVQFIGRTPTFKVFNEARVSLFNSKVEVVVSLPSSNKSIKLGIPCGQSSLQLSFLMQVCNPSLLPILTVEHLYIFENRFLLFSPHSQDNENTQWLELFHPFTSVKNLYLSKDLAPRIVPMLQDLVGERVTEVFPALQNICSPDLHLLTGPVQEAVQRFVIARRLSGYPVTLCQCD
jgi:hypothetical protein